MGDYIKTKELSDALGVSRKTVLDTARRDGWACIERSGGLQFAEPRLPSDVRFAIAIYRRNKKEDKALSVITPPTVPAARQDAAELVGHTFLQATDSAQDKAQNRANLIYEYKSSRMTIKDFIWAYNNCNAYPILFARLGPVSQRTFYRWVENWKEQGVSGIVPRYGMSSSGAGDSLTEEEKDLLKLFWLKSSQPTAAHAFRMMQKNIPYSKCSYQTALRYLMSIPKPVAGLFRLGSSRFENLFLPYMEQALCEYRSLEVVVSDHHCLDCVVMYQGQKIRPWLTTFQDLRSGKVLGWCPSVNPSSASIVVAYYMCCIRYGIPQGLLFDNGKDYRSAWLNGRTDVIKKITPDGITEEMEVEFRGLFALIGSEVHFTRTYNGKSKGRQERYFRIIGEEFSKEIGTYVGSDSRSRPEEAALLYRALDGKAMRGDIPDWTELVDGISAVIEYINDSFICNGKGMDGKTRSQVFAENLPSQDEIRWATKEELQKALTKGEIRKVGRNGVKVGKINYWHPDLFEFSGRQVIVYKSLVTDQELTCCRPDGSYLCTAIGNYFEETGDLSVDIERLQSARKHLTLIAEQGSGEVKAEPEFKTAIEVAKAQYGGRDELSDVDRFIALDEPVAAGAEDIRISAPKKKASNLKSPLEAGAEEYIQGVKK
jgi:hypothetical protein